MIELLVTMFASASVSAAITAILVWLWKTWISERLKNAIKHEYDQKLESHKARLQAEHDRDIETLKVRLKAESDTAIARLAADLKDVTAERDARRDYEYEARKRLYEQYEPLLFQLVERSESALHRVYSLARSAREGNLSIAGDGWLDSQGYYMVSTMYILLAPIAVFRLMQNRLTFVDLSVDPGIAARYALGKILYLSFTCDFELAKCKPSLEYEPHIKDWETSRKTQPSRYWRQGIALGRLDNALDDLLVVRDQEWRLRTFGEYESLLYGQTQENLITDSWRFADILSGFHPYTRPVLWRILIVQAHVHRLIVGLVNASASAIPDSLLEQLAIPYEQRDSFDWRSEDGEPHSERVLNEPFDVAECFISQYVKEFLMRRK